MGIKIDKMEYQYAMSESFRSEPARNPPVPLRGGYWVSVEGLGEEIRVFGGIEASPRIQEDEMKPELIWTCRTQDDCQC